MSPCARWSPACGRSPSTIEDGNITDVDKALRAAQEALKQALGTRRQRRRRSRSSPRTCARRWIIFMRQLAEQLRNNPQALARPLESQYQVLMRQQDLNNMIERMERPVALRRQGRRQAIARTAAADAGKSADGAARPVRRRRHGAGAQRARRHDPHAAALRDKTFKQGQDSRRDPPARQVGPTAWTICSRHQLGPARSAPEAAAGACQARHGQGQRGGRASRASRSRMAIRKRAPAMTRTASARLIARWATPRQARRGQRRCRCGFARARRWMRCARVPRVWLKRCSRGDGDGQGRRSGQSRRPAAERRQPERSLGRPLHGREFGDDLTVKIPGEIDVQRVRRILEELRRRLADPQRPQIELDYIERLLKDY